MIFGNAAFGGNTIDENEIPQGFLEMCIADEVAHLSDDKIREFCESEEAQALLERGVMRKKTLVRLSKKDDMSRRRTMAAFTIARDKKDPLWAKLVKNRVMERKLIGDIVKKYGVQAEKVAKVGQKEYLKQKMPLSFMRAGGADR